MSEILNCKEFASNLNYLAREFEIEWAEGIKAKGYPITQDSMDDWLDQFTSWLSQRKGI